MQIGPDQRCRQQPDGTGDAGATANPVEHVKAAQPLLRLGLPIQMAVEHGDGHRLGGPGATGRFQPKARLGHAQMGLRRTAGFAHHHHQRAAQALAEATENNADALGIDVVDEVERQAGVLLLQGPHHQQRPQTGATDADPEHIGEGRSAWRTDLASEQGLGEGVDALHLKPDVIGGGGIGGQLRSSQPVMAHLTLLIAIGDRTGLEGSHGGKGPLKVRCQLIKIRLGQGHAAHIQPEAEVVVVPEKVAETCPETGWILAVERRKRCHGLFGRRRWPRNRIQSCCVPASCSCASVRGGHHVWASAQTDPSGAVRSGGDP